LPADFEVFGQAVDSSMADLLGGTTGQILAKNSNTNMDFVWIANDQGDITGVTAGTGISGGGTSGAVTITNSMATEITAKADLIVGTGNAAFDNLPVGADGTVLTADSTVSPTGLKWATPSSGGMTLISTTTLTGSSVTLGTISGAYNELQLWIENFDPSTAARFRIAPNGNTTDADNVVLEAAGGGSATTQAYQGYMRTYNTFNTSPSNTIIAVFPAYTSTASRKSAYMTAGFLDGGGGNRTEAVFNKLEVGAITSLVLSPDAGTFSGGTAYLYGVK
jgi:hypothetical protein